MLLGWALELDIDIDIADMDKSGIVSRRIRDHSSLDGSIGVTMFGTF